jgi:hypothetical protein
LSTGGLVSRASRFFIAAISGWHVYPHHLLAFVIYGTRALQPRIERPGVSILLQGGSLAIADALLLTCVGWWAVAEINQYTKWTEQLAKERAAEKKQKVDREAAAAREAECLAERTHLIEKAKGARYAAKKRLDDCRVDFASKFRPFQSEEGFCESAQGRFESASRTVIAATNKVCSTGSIPRK